jgi:Putative restriction endonuclease
VDWFYAPGASPAPEGVVRDSYFLWQEGIAPLVIVVFVSGNGLEERDSTPWSGKLWIFEHAIRIPYYAIYEVDSGRVELFELVGGRYQPVPANEAGHYPIPALGVELGIWHGLYENRVLPWLRWWLLHGDLLPTTLERNIQMERRKIETAEQRIEQLKAQLRSLGVNPEEV